MRPRFLGDAAVDAGDASDGEAGAGAAVDEAEALRAVGGAAWAAAGAGAAHDPHVWAAAAALALTPRLLARAVPPHSFRAGYCGRFT